jgi:hypothetical protein
MEYCVDEFTKRLGDAMIHARMIDLRWAWLVSPSKYRVAFILDSLQSLYSKMSPKSSSEMVLSEINQFFQLLLDRQLDTASNNDRQFSPYILFIRPRLDRQWISRQICHDFGKGYYMIDGLDLADSIALAQIVLRDSGEDHQWQREDLDRLELVLSLLQWIPHAILRILPMAKKLHIPWCDFYLQLHSSLLGSITARNFIPENNLLFKAFSTFKTSCQKPSYRSTVSRFLGAPFFIVTRLRWSRRPQSYWD